MFISLAMEESPAPATQAPASISALAYAKIMLHSAKYPHCDVIGVLTGSRKAASGRPAVLDAFPLCHNPVTAPLFEVAMLVVRDDPRCREARWHAAPARRSRDRAD